MHVRQLRTVTRMVISNTAHGDDDVDDNDNSYDDNDDGCC